MVVAANKSDLAVGEGGWKGREEAGAKVGPGVGAAAEAGAQPCRYGSLGSCPTRSAAPGITGISAWCSGSWPGQQAVYSAHTPEISWNVQLLQFFLQLLIPGKFYV